MPIKLSEIQSKTKKITIDLEDDDSIEIEFKTAFYTPKTVARIEASERPLGTQVEILCESIVSWDIVGDDGKPMPIDEDTLDGLGVDLLNLIYINMRQATLPNALKADS